MFEILKIRICLPFVLFKNIFIAKDAFDLLNSAPLLNQKNCIVIFRALKNFVLDVAKDKRIF